jgi:hypothetical protein
MTSPLYFQWVIKRENILSQETKQDALWPASPVAWWQRSKGACESVDKIVGPIPKTVTRITAFPSLRRYNFIVNQPYFGTHSGSTHRVLMPLPANETAGLGLIVESSN